MEAAKRYRVDAEKLQKAVAKEFAAKRDKKTIKRRVARRQPKSIHSDLWRGANLHSALFVELETGPFCRGKTLT